MHPYGSTRTRSFRNRRFGVVAVALAALVTLSGAVLAGVTPTTLSIVKSADSAGVPRGSPIGFSIVVSTVGAVDALGVLVADTLPSGPGLDWSLSPAYPGCQIVGIAPATQTLTCNFASVPGSTSLPPIHVQSGTTGAVCSSVLNTAFVFATNAASTGSTASTDIQCPALTFTKLPDAAAGVSAGMPIGFTVTVSNSGAAGTATATGVSINDLLPARTGVSWSIAAGPNTCSIQGAPPAQTLVCTPLDLPPGALYSVHVTSPSTSGSCGQFNNTATMTSTNAPTLTAAASTAVLCSNLVITKTADAPSVSAGSPIGFTVTLANSSAAGTGAALGIGINDPLPAGTGVSWSVQSGPQNCTIQGAVPMQTLVCTPSDLPAGSSLVVHVTSPTTGSSCGTYSNTATVTGSNLAPVATADTTVLCPALSLTKLADSPFVVAGNFIGFTLAIHNTGAGTAAGVTLTDLMPNGSGSVHWSIDGTVGTPGAFTLSGADGAQSLALDGQPANLAPGASLVVRIQAPTSATSCGTFTNTAVLAATNAAPLTAQAVITCAPPRAIPTLAPAMLAALLLLLGAIAGAVVRRRKPMR